MNSFFRPISKHGSILMIWSDFSSSKAKIYLWRKWYSCPFSKTTERSSPLRQWFFCTACKVKAGSTPIYPGHHGPFCTNSFASTKTNSSFLTHGPSTLKTMPTYTTSSKARSKWSAKTFKRFSVKTVFPLLTLNSTQSSSGF